MNKINDCYRAVIIGTGQIASTIDSDSHRPGVWSHAGAYRACAYIKLVAACDVNPLRLNNFGRRWGVHSLYKDYEEMLVKELPDIVSVCTPTHTHYEIIKEIVKYNIKAIFCEKPLAFSSDECDHIVDMCADKNIVLAVNFFRRWDNLYLAVKEIIDSKQLGSLRTIVAYCNTALYMNSSHMIDLILMLCGPLSHVYGNLDEKYIREVHGLNDPGGVFYFKTETGVDGLLYATGDTHLKHQFEVDLQFFNGRIRSSHYGSENKYYEYRSSKQLGGLMELESVEFPPYARNERMVSAVENIVNVIAGRTDIINCSGRTATESIRVIDALYQSSRLGEIVYLHKKRTYERDDNE